MNRLLNYPKIQIILGVVFYSTFLTLATIPLPFLLMAEIFLPKKIRSFFWRVACYRLCSFCFRIFGLRVHRIGQIPYKPEQVKLYVSNHPSMLDPVYLFTLLGPDVITLGRPHHLQFFPFTIWFPKMDVVEVVRDAYDAVHCPTLPDRHAALKRLIDFAINERKSLLIFPEGHVESTKIAHYIHSGAARVAIRAKIPVVPVALMNMDHVFIGKLKFRPGHIYLKIHRGLQPPKVSHALPYRHAAKIFTKQLAAIMYSMLPHRALPIDLHDKNPERVGVFVDIDRTLYKYYSQQTFLKYLQHQGKVSKLVTFKIFGHLMLEKIGLLPHTVLMKRAYQFTKGHREAELAKMAEPFFKEEIIKDLVHNLFVEMKDHLKLGHSIFLVSEVIPPLARQFKLFYKALDIGVTLLEKRNGRYTGEVKQLCFFDVKAQQVKRLAKKYNIDLKKSYAYGDSPADIPMLELVKHPTAVRPKPALRHRALIEGWRIIH